MCHIAHERSKLQAVLAEWAGGRGDLWAYWWPGSRWGTEVACRLDVKAVNMGQERRNGVKAYHNTFDVKTALSQLYGHLGTWRAVAATLGRYSAGYWCGVAHGRWPASKKAENVLRRYLGLAPRGVTHLWQMTDADLRWYLRNRRETNYGR